MRLIITRHGQTEECLQGIWKGQLPGTLSETGILQAKRLAERLKNEQIDCIYSSELKRCADTASEIAKYHPDVQIEFTKELWECSLGKLEGKTREEVGIKKGDRPPIEYIKTCEGFPALFDRAKKFVDKIKTKHPNDTVLIVGHNIINRAIVAVITGKKPDDIPFVEKMDLTSITIIDVNEKSYEIKVYNCGKHL